MKLRIKGNTLRLRLSQGEVTEFEQKGAVSSGTSFDSAGSQPLVYVLKKSDDCEVVEATFMGNTIEVKVPVSLASKWVETNLVGFDNGVDPEISDALFILVEKDFQCLHKRPHEDESDNFPNPLAEKES